MLANGTITANDTASTNGTATDGGSTTLAINTTIAANDTANTNGTTTDGGNTALLINTTLATNELRENATSSGVSDTTNATTSNPPASVSDIQQTNAIEQTVQVSSSASSNNSAGPGARVNSTGDENTTDSTNDTPLVNKTEPTVANETNLVTGGAASKPDGTPAHGDVDKATRREAEVCTICIREPLFVRLQTYGVAWYVDTRQLSILNMQEMPFQARTIILSNPIVPDELQQTADLTIHDQQTANATDKQPPTVSKPVTDNPPTLPKPGTQVRT